MYPSRLFLSLLLAVSIVAAAPPKKALPLDISGDTVRVVRSFPITVTAPSGGKDYTWLYPSAIDADEVGNTLTIKSAPKGTHKIRVKVAFQDEKKDLTFDRGELLITVGDVPSPPGPKPPDPVDPPIPAGALRVLVVFESADLPAMKNDPARREQADFMFRPSFRGALKDRCDKKGPGGFGAVIWDKDQPGVERADKFWQDALKRDHPKLPAIHIFKGDKPVLDAELPKTEKEALDLINKYAGDG